MLGADGHVIPSSAFLQKPFALDTLAQCVRQMIDRTPKPKTASASGPA